MRYALALSMLAVVGVGLLLYFTGPPPKAAASEPDFELIMKEIDAETEAKVRSSIANGTNEWRSMVSPEWATPLPTSSGEWRVTTAADPIVGREVVATRIIDPSDPNIAISVHYQDGIGWSVRINGFYNVRLKADVLDYSPDEEEKRRERDVNSPLYHAPSEESVARSTNWRGSPIGGPTLVQSLLATDIVHLRGRKLGTELYTITLDVRDLRSLVSNGLEAYLARRKGA